MKNPILSRSPGVIGLLANGTRLEIRPTNGETAISVCNHRRIDRPANAVGNSNFAAYFIAKGIENLSTDHVVDIDAIFGPRINPNDDESPIRQGFYDRLLLVAKIGSVD